MSTPLPMQQLLKDTLTRAGMSKTQQNATNICRIANTMIKKHHALKHLSLNAASFREGVLTVHVVGSATSTDASMHVFALRKMINNACKSQCVTRIRLCTR